jgi:hypothetical protein
MFDNIKKKTKENEEAEKRKKAGERIMGIVNECLELLENKDLSVLEMVGVIKMLDNQFEMKKNRFLHESKTINIWGKKAEEQPKNT